MDVKNWRKALGVGLMTAAAITNSSAHAAAAATVTVDVNVPTILVMYHYSTITLNLDSAAVAGYLVGGGAIGCGLPGEYCDDQGAVAVAVATFGAANTIPYPVVDSGPGSTIVSFTLEDSVGVRGIGCSTYSATQDDAGSAAGIAIALLPLAGIDGSGCSFGMTTGDLSFTMDFAAIPANPVSAVFDVMITGI